MRKLTILLLLLSIASPFSASSSPLDGPVATTAKKRHRRNRPSRHRARVIIEKGTGLSGSDTGDAQAQRKAEEAARQRAAQRQAEEEKTRESSQRPGSGQPAEKMPSSDKPRTPAQPIKPPTIKPPTVKL